MTKVKVKVERLVKSGTGIKDFGIWIPVELVGELQAGDIIRIEDEDGNVFRGKLMRAPAESARDQLLQYMQVDE